KSGSVPLLKVIPRLVLNGLASNLALLGLCLVCQRDDFRRKLLFIELVIAVDREDFAERRLRVRCVVEANERQRELQLHVNLFWRPIVSRTKKIIGMLQQLDGFFEFGFVI